MEATNKFDAMGKAELRAACKEYGVKNYGKMDNAGMRAALVAATQSAVEQAAPVAETEVVATEPAPAPASNVLGSMFARMIDPSIQSLLLQSVTLTRLLTASALILMQKLKKKSALLVNLK